MIQYILVNTSFKHDSFIAVHLSAFIQTSQFILDHSKEEPLILLSQLSVKKNPT